MAKKIPAVSVIIPMYNTEKFIEECLQSLLNQTLKNIEVILIDDCSTDNSVEVAAKMIQAFANNGGVLNIQKLQENTGGPGLLRNEGVNLAKGKYVYFLDSDDFLDSTAFEDLYKVAEKFNADVVHSEKFFHYEEINGEMQDTLSSLQAGEFVEEPTLETSDIGQRVSDFTLNRYLWWGCNKLIRRKFLIENEIKFPAMSYFEDLVFSFQCLVCAKNYVRVPFVNYHYRIRKGSLSHGSPSTVKTSLNLLEGTYVLDSFMQRQKFFAENESYRYALIDFFNQIFLDSISENLFILKELEPSEVYAFYSREIFTLDPQKNIPLMTYLFVSSGIYRLFVKQQAAEIDRLKKLVGNSE